MSNGNNGKRPGPNKAHSKLQSILTSKRVRCAVRDVKRRLFRPLWGSDDLNPIIRRVHKLLIRQEKEAIRTSRNALFEIIGRLSERPSVLAHISAIYLAMPDGGLKPVALHNHSDEASGYLRSDSKGMVASVSRSRKTLYAPDVSILNSDNYVGINRFTKSELVVPIIWQGDLLGIINLESRVIDGFSMSQPEIDKVLPSIRRHLLVLQSCYSKKEDWLPWNPLVHSWSLNSTISQILQMVGAELSSVSAKMTVWYPDHDKESLFANATYGYDWAFVNGESLSLKNSEIGNAIIKNDASLIRLDPNAFIKRDKAMSLGIEEAWAANVQNVEPDQPPVATITCYFASKGRELNEVEKNERKLALDTIQKLAVELSQMILTYKEQRERYALAYICQINDMYKDCQRRTRFEEWLNAIRIVLASPAGSVFQKNNARGRLQCIASTGFYNEQRQTRSIRLRDHFYDLNSDVKSHTLAIWNLKGQPFRRLNVGNPQEKGMKDTVPIVADYRVNAEFLPGQNLTPSPVCPRQLLGVAYSSGGVLKGVIRLVRSVDDHPFTKCDEHLLATIAAQAAPAAINAADVNSGKSEEYLGNSSMLESQQKYSV